jgi:hypothetical protein
MMASTECTREKQEPKQGDFDLSMAKNLLVSVNVVPKRRFTSEGGAPSTPCIATPVARRSSALSNSDEFDLPGPDSAQEGSVALLAVDEVRLSLWLHEGWAEASRVA